MKTYRLLTAAVVLATALLSRMAFAQADLPCEVRLTVELTSQQGAS
jgi:hypothetical protein